jgi:hypothetical protein
MCSTISVDVPTTFSSWNDLLGIGSHRSQTPIQTVRNAIHQQHRNEDLSPQGTL